MLGMMNCPTSENLDFYASSPSAMRQISGDDSKTAKLGNGPLKASSSDDQLAVCGQHGLLEKRSSCNALEVFSTVKQRPKLSYTEDGRRMIDGKLESGQSTPEKLWNRLIVDSVTTQVLCRREQQHCSSSQEAEAEQLEEKPKRRFSFGSLFLKKCSSTSSSCGSSNSSSSNSRIIGQKEGGRKKASASSTKSAGSL